MLDTLKKAIWISRPFAWLFGPVAYFLGVAASGGQIGLFNLFQMFLLSAPLAFYINGINDIHDRHTDRINPRRKNNIFFGRPLEDKDIPFVWKGSMISVLLILASTFLFSEPIHILVTLILLPVPYIYSAPPLRLKSVPIADSIINSAVALGPFAMGFSIAGGLGFLAPHFVLFTLTFSAAHALGTIMDMKEDKIAGIKTFATVFGPRAPALFATVMFAINIPFAFNVMASAGVVITINALFALYVFLKGDQESVKLAIKCTMALFILWLIFLPISRFLNWEHTNYFWL
jgi:4-hydroxybenzoate polyprenyltransferase